MFRIRAENIRRLLCPMKLLRGNVLGEVLNASRKTLSKIGRHPYRSIALFLLFWLFLLLLLLLMPTARENKHAHRSEGCQWMPEYGSWMVEGIPKRAFEGSTTSLARVERNMRLRRTRLLEALGEDEIAPTVSVYSKRNAWCSRRALQRIITQHLT